MHYQVSLLFLIGIAALSAAQTASNGCPDDTYTYKETKSGPNRVRRCYKLYQAADRTDQCKVIDYCRPLHPKAIPATINSIEERDFLKTLADDTFTLIGFHIPCGQGYDKNSFVNIDGTPLPEGALELLNNMQGDEYLGMIAHSLADDLSLRQQSKSVICAITLPNTPCPDDSYSYHEINGIGKCYKSYTVPYQIERCDLINACRSLNSDAIPATIGSIEEREYMKTIVNPAEYTVIGVSIPCPLPYNIKHYKNVDGTKLPAPLEVTTGMWPDQYVGMLFDGKTDNLDLHDPMFQGKVLCTIPIWYSCPPGTYPDSYNGRVTMNTSCVQYVPYVPGSTPEAVCAKANSKYSFQPPAEIPCSLPHNVQHTKPNELPYCNP